MKGETGAAPASAAGAMVLKYLSNTSRRYYKIILNQRVSGSARFLGLMVRSMQKRKSKPGECI